MGEWETRSVGVWSVNVLDNDIRLELELDEASGVYTITSPDVPGLVTEGSTPQEIAHNVQEALEALMLAWQELGKPPPPALRTVSRRINSPKEEEKKQEENGLVDLRRFIQDDSFFLYKFEVIF